MHGNQPRHHNYPSNVAYNPRLRSSYQRPSPFDPVPGRNSAPPRNNPNERAFADEPELEERARALAERRARRAQYLPDEQDDEDEDDDDDWWSSQWEPRQRANLEAKARQEVADRQQREEEMRRQQEEETSRRQEEEVMRRQEDELRRQRATEQQQRRREELARRHKQEEETRQRMIEEQKNQIRLRREEEARRLAAAEQERQTRFSQQEAQRRAASRSHSRGPEVRFPFEPAHQPSGQARPPMHPPPASREDTSVPIHIATHTHPSTGKPPSTGAKAEHMAAEQAHTQPTESQAKPPSPKPTRTVEEQNEAAARIQKQYRIHASFRTLHQIQTQFETLKKEFVYPCVIDFEKPVTEEGIIGVPAYRAPSDFDKEDFAPMDVDGPAGKLAYTSTNFPLNAYSDQLDKLLIRLDGVESWGQKRIREQRRSEVKAIEKEASKLDRYCKQAWMDYVAKMRQAQSAMPSNKLSSEKPSSDAASQPVKIQIKSNQQSADNSEVEAPTDAQTEQEGATQA